MSSFGVDSPGVVARRRRPFAFAAGAGRRPL